MCGVFFFSLSTSFYICGQCYFFLFSLSPSIYFLQYLCICSSATSPKSQEQPTRSAPCLLPPQLLALAQPPTPTLDSRLSLRAPVRHRHFLGSRDPLLPVLRCSSPHTQTSSYPGTRSKGGQQSQHLHIIIMSSAGRSCILSTTNLDTPDFRWVSLRKILWQVGGRDGSCAQRSVEIFRPGNRAGAAQTEKIKCFPNSTYVQELPPIHTYATVVCGVTKAPDPLYRSHDCITI